MKQTSETPAEAVRNGSASDPVHGDNPLTIDWKDDILIPSKSPSFEEDLLSIIRGFRNGLIYGIKIRFPHAFVMTLLFAKNQSVGQMANTVFTKTQQHSLNLGRFVCLYKVLVVLIRRILKFPHNHFPIIHILAGGIGGGIVWGQRTSINHQINLYVFSRIFMGLVRSAVERGYFDGKSWRTWYLAFAATTWAIVMYLFEFEEHNLSKSLAASMRYLYHNEMRKPKDLKQIWQWMSTSSV